MAFFPASLAAGVLLASLLLQNPQPAAPARDKKQKLTVLSYNVHHCNPPEKPGVIDIDAIAAVVRKSDADLVALQEIDVNTGRSGKRNQASEIALKAGYTSFYFGKAMDYDGGGYGVLILSKYPLQETTTHPLPGMSGSQAEPRVLATALLSLPNGEKIRFGSTHLDAQRADSNRILQVGEINRIAAAYPEPFIVAGDFNAVETNPVIQTLDSLFTRTCRPCEPTIEEGGQPVAIDFIAFRPGDRFSIDRHEVLPEKKASDHQPVLAVLEIK